MEVFLIDDEHFMYGDAKNELQCGFSISDARNRIIAGHVFYEVKMKGERILYIHVACQFTLDIPSWNLVYDKQIETMSLSPEFVKDLSVKVLDIAKGVLHVKVEGTKFKGHIMPEADFESQMNGVIARNVEAKNWGRPPVN